MPVTPTTFHTITCDNKTCEHKRTITYNVAQQKETFEHADNAWMKNLRNVQAVDGRVLTYCSDVCEVEGVKTGLHNMPQKKLIESAATPAQIEQAAAAARAAEQAGEALKQGRPVSGIVS